MTRLAQRSKAVWGYSDEFMRACRAEMSISPSDIEAQGKSYMVLESDGVLLGFYCLQDVTEEQVELDALYIDPDHIGCRLGRTLLSHAVDSARNDGAKKLTIQSDPNAVGFYEAAGARQVGTLESGSIPGRFLPLMEITLTEPPSA